MTALRDVTAAIEAAVSDQLGDEITYTPEGGQPLTFNAWVEFDSEELRSPGSASTARVRIVEVPKSVIAAVSKEGDRIAIALLPAEEFKPAAIVDTPDGTGWRITLMRVRNG